MVKSAVLLGIGISIGLAIPISFIQGQDSKPKQQTVGDFPDLRKGLLETPGCLGVDQFVIGKKFVIAAWFENRKAMEAWYYSKMHQDAMHKFFPDLKGGKPFPAFTDDKAPLLVVASVTPADRTAPGTNLAVSQIAIEGFTPIPGGIYLGGRFAPDSVKVPGMMKIDGK